MTGALLAAMAVFVAGHGDQLTPQQEYDIIREPTIIMQYYTGPDCKYLSETYKVGDKPVWECRTNKDDMREKEFYIVFDLKNQTRERHRKTTLLWLYAKQRYESTK